MDEEEELCCLRGIGVLSRLLSCVDCEPRVCREFGMNDGYEASGKQEQAVQRCCAALDEEQFVQRCCAALHAEESGQRCVAPRGMLLL